MNIDGKFNRTRVVKIVQYIYRGSKVYVDYGYFNIYFSKVKIILVAIGVVSIILNLIKSYVLIKSGLRRKTDAGLLISTVADIITVSFEVPWLISLILDEQADLYSYFIPITDELRSSSAWITVLLATQRYYSITDNIFYKRR